MGKFIHNAGSNVQFHDSGSEHPESAQTAISWSFIVPASRSVSEPLLTFVQLKLGQEREATFLGNVPIEPNVLPSSIKIWLWYTLLVAYENSSFFVNNIPISLLAQ